MVLDINKVLTNSFDKMVDEHKTDLTPNDIVTVVMFIRYIKDEYQQEIKSIYH